MLKGWYNVVWSGRRVCGVCPDQQKTQVILENTSAIQFAYRYSYLWAHFLIPSLLQVIDTKRTWQNSVFDLQKQI